MIDQQQCLIHPHIPSLLRYIGIDPLAKIAGIWPPRQSRQFTAELYTLNQSLLPMILP